MPLAFNMSESIFLPKGTQAGDAAEIIRKPEDTRPLSLKSTDNKTCSGILNIMLRDVATAGVSSIQRGFVAQRQLTQNIVDLDCAARAYGHPHHARHLPVLAFWDIAAAFPSLQHSWIWASFRALGMPSGILSCIQMIYHMNMAFIMGVFAFFFEGGSLQGCPLSGFVYAVSTHPFAERMKHTVDLRGLGTTRICADDVGAAILHMSTLREYSATFAFMQFCAGLRLKLKKCVLIPLYAAFSCHVVEVIRDALMAIVPGWVDFGIVKIATYLGYPMGPNVVDDMWGPPVQKWQPRADAIALAKGSATVTIKEYNTKAIPTLLYIAQFSLPPRTILQAESAIINKLWHVPPSTFTVRGMAHASQFGAVDVTSASVACVSALIRAACLTIDWKTPLDLLRGADYEAALERRVGNLAREEPWAKHWKSPAIAWTLERVTTKQAIGTSKQLHEAMNAAINAVLSSLVIDPSGAVGLRRAPPSGSAAGRRRALMSGAVGLRRALHGPCSHSPLRGLSSGLQRTAYHTMKKVIFNTPPGDALKARLRLHWPDAVDDINSIDFTNLMNIMKKSHAQAVVHPCLFGCPARDEWTHYADCFTLWSTVHSLIGKRPPPKRFDTLALNAKTADELKTVFIAYETYHRIKHSHLGDALLHLQLRQHDELSGLTDRLAHAAARLCR
ncbi:unnamed protein product [Prorocentrum cordatum]|uniref:Reverse transcriptase domain-containing protein n=1 Tax=Prorocentrum cordatum TaxID=2364126 RepID=A0ABN9THU5_9DINO|nr:unnamed protein product [Polarella glacialis]